jgi:hypothetical protein
MSTKFEDARRKALADAAMKKQGKKATRGAAPKAVAPAVITDPKAVIAAQRIRGEIISTEESYGKSMQQLVSFVDAINRAVVNKKESPILHKFGNSEEGKKFLSEVKGAMVIAKLSEEFLKELKALDAETPPRADVNARMASILSKYTPFFDAYTGYVWSYSQISQILPTFEQKLKGQELLDWSNLQQRSFGNINAASVLIMPIQRLPRYVLLLKELVKNSPETEKPVIENCLSRVSEKATKVNEAQKLCELNTKLSKTYLKGSGKSENQWARSVEFSSNKPFFKTALIEMGDDDHLFGPKMPLKKELQNLLTTGSDNSKSLTDPDKDLKIEIKSIMIPNVTLSINGKEVKFKIIKGAAGQEISGKDASTAFHVRIEENMEKLAPFQQRAYMEIAEKIGLVVLKRLKEEPETVNVRAPHDPVPVVVDIRGAKRVGEEKPAFLPQEALEARRVRERRAVDAESQKALAQQRTRSTPPKK